MDDTLRKNIKEAYDSLPEYIGELRTNFMRAADLWRVGRDREAEEIYIHTLEAFGYFVELVDLLVSRGGISEDDTYREVETALLEASRKLEEASREGDLTMVPDIVEYELIPAIERVGELHLSDSVEGGSDE